MTGESEIKPIRRGEFVMLRGPSGCGKTTLLNILGTIDRASSGEIREFLTFHMPSIELELI